MANNIFHNAASIIPSNRAYLERPHIYELLEKSLKKPITTIVAGAGYGKTQAVYNFLQRYDAVTIWLQTSMFDNLPMRLWENFVYTISLLNEELASNLKSLSFPDTIEAYHRFLGLLAMGMKRDKKYVLVYDDFHLIHEDSIFNFFKMLINAYIPNLSFIFISRSEPDINTIGLLSKGLLSGITEDDLRFSESEMIQYFQIQDIQLTSKAVLDIYNYTGGWIFAIHLVGLSLKKGLTHENYAIPAAKENIFRLIDNEIFSVLSKELQDFLIKLSLIDDLPLELLKELSSYNDKLISEMAEISVFIRYDTFINTYRIHQLFLQFLKEKQAAIKADEKIEIYKKSADWYDKNGYKIDALTYYEKTGQYDEIIEIIIIYYSCPKETAQFILELLEKTPEELYEEKPILRVLHAKFLFNNFRIEEALNESLNLIEKYESMPQNEENRAIIGEIYTILGIMDLFRCLFTSEYAFQQYFKIAAEYLPNGSTMLYNNILLNIGNFSCCVNKPLKGEFDRFTNAMCYAMPYASKVMNGSGQGTEYLCLTEKAYFQRDLKNAEKYAYQAINESREQKQYDVESLAIFYLIRINVKYGYYTEIISLLNQLRLMANKYNNSVCYKILDITEGWFYSLIGETHKVADWITDDSENAKIIFQYSYGIDHLIRARCYLAEQKYDELLAFLEKQGDGYGLEVFLLGAIEKKVIKAIALYRLKEKKLSYQTLQEAYDLAHSNFIEMSFIEYGDNMRTLTDAIINDKECAIPIKWLNNINIKSSAYAKKCDYIIAEHKMSNSL